MLRVLLISLMALGGFLIAPHRGIAAMHDRSPAGRALVLEPFATELQLPSGAGDIEVRDLQSAGYQVDQAYDTTVTVSAMTSLSHYNVVYMHTHSGPDLGGVVATGEPANGDPSVAPLLAERSVIAAQVAGSTQHYYGITPLFVSKYEDQFPHNSLLFLNGCSLLSGTSFWQALAAKGLGALVSWDGESSVKDNFLAAAAFFNEMDQGMTVSQAITALRQGGYGTSTVNGQTATLGYLGDGTITLQSAMESSSPSPSPSTSTPTPTSTSIPTSTPTSPPASGPPLTMTLKSRVNPGSRQTLTVRSDPKVTVRFRITFPNGDHLSARRTTSASGVVRYTYVQPANTVTRGHVFATVTVEATTGSASSTRTERYRIGWDRVDLSVEPRRQSLGQPVTIWIHTQPHTRVTVSLSVPDRGTIERLSGSTNAQGWLHLRYRIGRSLQASKAHAVTVRATVRLRTGIYHATAGITIM